jgi:hypothetical protein
LLPERVTTLVVAPPVPPYSGGALCVRILGHHATERIARRIDELRPAGDGHRLFDRRQLHPHVDADGLADGDLDGLLNHGPARGPAPKAPGTHRP